MINILMSRSSALNASWASGTLSNYLKPNMKVAVIGYSFFGNLSEENYFDYYGENSEYQQKINDNFKEYGIKDVKWVYYYNQSLEEMTKIIKDSNILYFPGGAPDLMFDRINEKGLVDVLKAHEGIVIGSSAGAMIQLEKYHISPDNEYFKFSLHEGLGYLKDFFIEVHYRRRVKQKSSLRKMRRLFGKDIYTISDDGILVVDNNKFICLNEAKHFSNKKGIVK